MRHFNKMMKGYEKAQEIIAAAGTQDVFQIARQNNVPIVYESWYPVTAGEFARNVNVIYVNKRAVSSASDPAGLEKNIIAHELGHYFANGWNISRSKEEMFANDFAKAFQTLR